jgi:hypothetical protein
LTCFFLWRCWSLDPTDCEPSTSPPYLLLRTPDCNVLPGNFCVAGSTVVGSWANCCAMVLLLDLLLIVVLLTNSHLLHRVPLCVIASRCCPRCWCTTDSCEHHGQAQEVGLRLHHDLCPTMRGAVELLLRNEGCW